MDDAALIWTVAHRQIEPTEAEVGRIRGVARNAARQIVNSVDRGQPPSEHLVTIYKLWEQVGRPEPTPVTGIGLFAIMASMAGMAIELSESEFCCASYADAVKDAAAPKKPGSDPDPLHLHEGDCSRIALAVLRHRL